MYLSSLFILSCIEVSVIQNVLRFGLAAMVLYWYYRQALHMDRTNSEEVARLTIYAILIINYVDSATKTLAKWLYPIILAIANELYSAVRMVYESMF